MYVWVRVQCRIRAVGHLMPKTRIKINREEDERGHCRLLPARGRCQLLPIRQQRCSLTAAPLLSRRLLHAGARSCSAAEPAGSPLHRPAAHRQRRRTAPVLPLLGARRPAKVRGRESICVCVPTARTKTVGLILGASLKLVVGGAVVNPGLMVVESHDTSAFSYSGPVR